jgi:hypothetical protein
MFFVFYKLSGHWRSHRFRLPGKQAGAGL